MLPAFPLCRAFFTNVAREFQDATLLSFVFAYRRVVKRDYLSSSNASRSDAAKQARLWYIATHSTRVQTLVTLRPHRVALRSSYLLFEFDSFFHRVLFLFFFLHVFTYRRNHPPAGKLGWRHNGRPGITRSPSVLKSPSITRIGRLPTSNIIIIISPSLHCEKGINATQWREKRARFVDTLMTNNKSLYIYRRYFTKLSLKLYRFEEG